MRPLRIPAVQAALSFILAYWMQFCFATMRWTYENQGVAEGVWARGGGVLCAFWHSRIGLSPACWPLNRAQPAKALISLSADGQFIAKAVAHSLARAAAVAGLGFSILPDFIAAADIAAGRLLPLLDDRIAKGAGIYAVYPHRRYLPAKVRVFVDFLAHWFKKHGHA